MTSPKDMREWERARELDSPEEKKHPWPLALRMVIVVVGVYFMFQGIAQVKEGYAKVKDNAAWAQPAQHWQPPTNNGYGPQQQQPSQYGPPQQYPAQYGPQQQYPAQYGPQQPAQTYGPPGRSNDDW